jgi:hypothetical protein
MNINFDNDDLYEFDEPKYDIDMEIYDQRQQDWDELTKEYEKYLQLNLTETF